MRTILISLVGVLAATSICNAATLKVWLDADQVTLGDYAVRIYAQTFGLDPSVGEGISDMAVTVYTPDSVGLTVPKLVNPATDTVKTTWNPAIPSDEDSGMIRLKPRSHDFDHDGDPDAGELVITWTLFTVPGIDMTSPTLIATETWTMLTTPYRYVSLDLHVYGMNGETYGQSRYWNTEGTQSPFDAYETEFQSTMTIATLVPEPGTLVLLVTAGIALLRRRR